MYFIVSKHQLLNYVLELICVKLEDK